MHEITGKIKSTLGKTFDEATRYTIVDGQKVADLTRKGATLWTLPDLAFFQPPSEFEKQNGIHGFSCQYILPQGLLPRELQEYAKIARLNDQDMHEKLNEVWEQLKKDNEKTLGSLKFDTNNTIQLYNVILGVASAFLPRDIQSWIDGNTSVSALREEQETESLMNKIETHFGRICWVPCLDTLRLIDRKIDDNKNSVVQKASTESSFTDLPVASILKDADCNKSAATSSVTGKFSPQR
ncbi:MAG: hypothetical protein KAS59_03615 [Alphaproteobacteria bacterium]|nr:hypothetical protein [Alphaproteobacteria bacterium]MCK5556325.1 hypothetical protein [Alphaproteobacteria bacterium]